MWIWLPYYWIMLLHEIDVGTYLGGLRLLFHLFYPLFIVNSLTDGGHTHVEMACFTHNLTDGFLIEAFILFIRFKLIFKLLFELVKLSMIMFLCLLFNRRLLWIWSLFNSYCCILRWLQYLFITFRYIHYFGLITCLLVILDILNKALFLFPIKGIPFIDYLTC